MLAKAAEEAARRRAAAASTGIGDGEEQTSEPGGAWDEAMMLANLMDLRQAAAETNGVHTPPVTIELMDDWSKDDAQRFFESGGLYFPPSRHPDGSRFSKAEKSKRAAASAPAASASAPASASAAPPSDDGAASSAAAKREPRRVVLIPDNEDETWCALLKADLESDGTAEVFIGDHVKLKRLLDARVNPYEHAKAFGVDPEQTVVVGRTDGADCALFHLEQRRLGGVVVWDFKNRRAFLWRTISKHAGPNGGNLALLNSEPPMGSRFSYKFADKLDVEVVDVTSATAIEKLSWATRAAIRGADNQKPQPVSVLGLTAGLTARAYTDWELPFGEKFVEIVPIHADRHFDLFSKPGRGGLAAAGRAIAAELVGADPCKLDKPSIILGHDLGAWLAYEVVIALQALHASAGKDCRWQVPSVLLVSGMRPPHLHEPYANDPDRKTPLMAPLETEAFFNSFKRRFGLPPQLQNDPDTRAIFEPMLRQMMELTESYEPSGVAKAGFGRDKVISAKPITPGALRIVACAAKGDERLSEGQLEGWRGYAGTQPLKDAAVAGLAGVFAGDGNEPFACVEFDMIEERRKKDEREKERAHVKETTIRVEATNFMRLTYKPIDADASANFTTGEPHRYIIETPDPLMALVAAEAMLLGLRAPPPPPKKKAPGR